MIKFYSSNLVDQSTVTASTENAFFPVQNIQDSRRTKVFRSTTNSDSVVFDFQEASEFDSIIIVDNPSSGFGISTITLEANATNTWGAPAFSQSVTYSTEYGIGIVEFTAQTYRFARLVLTSTLGYCELSKVFIGKKIETSRGINQGWTYRDSDLSTITENRYGQKFVDLRERQRVFNGSMSNLDQGDMDLIFEIYDDKGISKPFYIQIGCADGISDIRRFTSMVYLTSIPTITNRFFNNYALSLSMEEAK